jgi:hypothetical protein
VEAAEKRAECAESFWRSESVRLYPRILPAKSGRNEENLGITAIGRMFRTRSRDFFSGLDIVLWFFLRLIAKIRPD